MTTTTRRTRALADLEAELDHVVQVLARQPGWSQASAERLRDHYLDRSPGGERFTSRAEAISSTAPRMISLVSRITRGDRR